jgi:hypothetical protein
MVLASPVSHVHHYAMALPAICGLWLKGLADRPGHAWPSPLISVSLFIWCVGTGLPLLPGRVFVQMREFGLGTGATVLIWGVSLSLLMLQGRAIQQRAVGDRDARRKPASGVLPALGGIGFKFEGR